MLIGTEKPSCINDAGNAIKHPTNDLSVRLNEYKNTKFNAVDQT